MSKCKKKLFLIFWTVFFEDPDFSGSDPDFWPIRIRTQEQKSVPDPVKKSGSETWLLEVLVAQRRYKYKWLYKIENIHVESRFAKLFENKYFLILFLSDRSWLCL